MLIFLNMKNTTTGVVICPMLVDTHTQTDFDRLYISYISPQLFSTKIHSVL